MTKARTLADNYAADINQITASAPLTGGGTSGTVTVGIQAGTTAQSGAVQLTDSTASTSITTAATPNSVKSAYDLANGAIAKSLVDAKGDLLVGSANDTVSRLAVASTAGYVLTVDSAEATGLKWGAISSGGRTLLSTQTISSQNSFEFTSIPSGYNQLDLIITGTQDKDDTYFYVYFNNDQTGKYFINGTTGNSSTTDRKVMVSNAMGTTEIGASHLGGFIPSRYNGSTQQSAHLTIFNADETSMPKVFKYEGMGWATSFDYYVNAQGWGCYTGTSAISRITITGTGNSTPYWTGTAKLYGVK